jgi:hypothetical protein
MTNANTQPKPPPAAAPRRMTLGSVTRGPIQQPLRIMLFGPEGIGKSTFGANAPNPIFLGAEDGTGQLDVARFPEPRSWADALDAVRELTEAEHPYKTLVVDTLDWLEPLVWRHVCERDRKRTIEEYGYGKGYVAALDEWRVLVAAFERLRRAKPVNVVLLAHSLVRTFKNPEGDDYDRFNLKINEKAAGLLKEWCDAVLFANYETHVLKDGNRAKGYGGGARVMHTERRAAWDAKNRFGLPEKLPLDWAEFREAVKANAGAKAAEAIRREIAERLPRVADEERRKDIAAKAAAAGDNVSQLRVELNRINALTTAEDGKEGSQ